MIGPGTSFVPLQIGARDVRPLSSRNGLSRDCPDRSPNGVRAAQVMDSMWEPSERYPDPAVRLLHPSFAKYRLAQAAVERLAAGFRWAEGPVWFGDGRFLLWSDIPNNRIMRWDEETGAANVFRKPSNHANGNTRDRQGRLVTCEPAGRRGTPSKI